MTPAWSLVILGLLLLAGFAANEIGRRAHVPRVTLLLLIGVLAGEEALDVVPVDIEQWFPFVAQIALSLIGFRLGEEFVGSTLRRAGKTVVVVTLAESLGAALVVFGVAWAVGAPLPVALVLAGIAPASAPAATFDVVRESRSKGPVTDLLLKVVATDDAVGIVLFVVLLVAARAVSGQQDLSAELLFGLWEVGGAVALGVVLGLPMAWLTGRVRPGELTLIETLGFVFACGGLASLVGVSYLLACIVLGAVVANRAKHHHRPFHAIEGVTQPFLTIFFVLAGLEFDWRQLGALGLLGLGYVFGRSLGLVGGAAAGVTIGGGTPTMRRTLGWCLLPQAGVALGLALLASERLPGHGPKILTLLVGTTFVFEVIGPIATRLALRRAGETHTA